MKLVHANRLILDTAILGEVVHPRKYEATRDWLAGAVENWEVLVSEVCDYELRRELLRIGAERSLRRLEELGRELRYLPVTTATWRDAARLWAAARRSGRPTASADALDGDVLIAAQAKTEVAIVVAPNSSHFEALGVDSRAPSDLG